MNGDNEYSSAGARKDAGTSGEELQSCEPGADDGLVAEVADLGFEDASMTGYKSGYLIVQLDEHGIVEETAVRSGVYNALYKGDRSAECGRGRGHTPPGDTCECGWYALRSTEKIVTGAYSGAQNLEAGGVLVEVSLYGEVIEGTRGWRGSHQRLMKIVVPPTCATTGCHAMVQALTVGSSVEVCGDHELPDHAGRNKVSSPGTSSVSGVSVLGGGVGAGGSGPGPEWGDAGGTRKDRSQGNSGSDPGDARGVVEQWFRIVGKCEDHVEDAVLVTQSTLTGSLGCDVSIGDPVWWRTTGWAKWRRDGGGSWSQTGALCTIPNWGDRLSWMISLLLVGLWGVLMGVGARELSSAASGEVGGVAVGGWALTLFLGAVVGILLWAMFGKPMSLRASRHLLLGTALIGMMMVGMYSIV